jgi:DNA-binding response OmpR family regulator
MNVKTVLVVDDDDDIGTFLVQAILQETPHQAIHASNGSQAWTIMQSVKPDVLVLDYNLPSITGIEFYNRVRARKEFEDIPALIITADPKRCKKEVDEYQLSLLKKPFELDELLKTITHLLEKEPM